MTDDNQHLQSPEPSVAHVAPTEAAAFAPDHAPELDAAGFALPDDNRFYEWADVAGRRTGHRKADFMAELSHALGEGDNLSIIPLLKVLHAADVADILEALPGRERGALIELISQNFDPDILAEIEGEAQDQLLDLLPNDQIAEAVGDMESDDAVYVLEELDETDRAEVLDALSEPDRMAFEKALAFPEDSAGRLMQADIVALPQFWSVGQTIDFLRKEDAELPSDFYEVIVVDPAHKPVGRIPASRILRTSRDATLSDVMVREPHTLDVLMDQEDVAYQFRKYHLITAAVVDSSGRLMGVVTVDDVVDVIDEEAEEDILALAGVGETSLNEGLGDATRGRFYWLLINLATAALASLVIGLFDATLERMVALAILMPIIASMGGNAATQTMTVAVRALASRELTSVTAGRALRRELLMAGINGILLALVSGLAAFIWFWDMALGLIFAGAMITNILIAALSGLMIPLILQRLKIDPAIASSVFVTTITDVMGFFAFLGLAALVLF